MAGIKIVGMGSYLPEKVVTNDDFAKIVETSDEWIVKRTGISTRHIACGEPTWYLGTQAAENAVKDAGIDVSEIGLIICTTVTPDYSTPSTSCIIQRELGAIGCMAIDVNCACSGFVYATDMARRYLMTDDSIKYVLVVANESLSKITDYSDRATCILFGDGAAAAVYALEPEGEFTSYLGADGNGAKFLCAKGIPPRNAFTPKDCRVYDCGMPEGNGTYLAQDGKEVYKFAVNALPDAVTKALEKKNMSVDEIDWFIPHQANVRIIETAAKNLGVSMDKFCVNLATHGNTSSASIPLCLDEFIKNGTIKRGDRICLVGFGAGLTYGAVIFDY